MPWPSRWRTRIFRSCCSSSRRNGKPRRATTSCRTNSAAFPSLPIRYEHLPELGIASEDRRELKTQADYDTLFAGYERDSLPKQEVALAKIRQWIEQDGHRVALTCYEAQPCQCHRHCVAEALAEIGGKAFSPIHL